MGAATVWQHQHQVKLAFTSNRTEHLQHHAVEGMVTARYANSLWKVVGVGSVSGVPSTRLTMTG